MVLCLKGEDERGQFADAPFPVILYNDSLKEALGNNSGIGGGQGRAQHGLLVCERFLPVRMADGSGC